MFGSSQCTVLLSHKLTHKPFADCAERSGREATGKFEKQLSYQLIIERRRMMANMLLAEREGFEPPIPLRVCRISSAVLSTTQPPLRALSYNIIFRFDGFSNSQCYPNCYRSVLTLALPARFSNLESRTKPYRRVGLHSVGHVAIQVHCSADG